ncbi:hypothetical protein N8Z73_00325 [bacterium]|nr:hypothetical protein [bacterium]MDC1221898.1 hypothetical protein [Salibacteraceae bacterium]
MKKFSLIALAAIALCVTSCKKETEDDMEEDVVTTSSEDQALAQGMFDDLGTQSEGSSESAESEDSTWTSCATITVVELGSPWPYEITVDFGAVNCKGQDGKERRGKVIYTITDWFRNTGSVIEVTTEDYFVNDYQIEGTRSSSNLGPNAKGQMEFGISVVDGKVTTPDGDIILWESERTRTWVEGQETNFFTLDSNNMWMGWDGITDDVYEIRGSGNGTSRNNIDYTVDITTPLRVQLDCRWITEGVISLKPDGYDARSLDYGAGDCDNKATVAIGENEKEISLRG